MTNLQHCSPRTKGHPKAELSPPTKRIGYDQGQDMIRNNSYLFRWLYKGLPWSLVRSTRLLRTSGESVLCFWGICIRTLLGVHGVSGGGRPWEMDWSRSISGNAVLPVGLGLPKDTLRCVRYHGFCFQPKACPPPFAAFGTCSERQKTCCIGTDGNPARAGSIWRGD